MRNIATCLILCFMIEFPTCADDNPSESIFNFERFVEASDEADNLEGFQPTASDFMNGINKTGRLLTLIEFADCYVICWADYSNNVFVYARSKNEARNNYVYDIDFVLRVQNDIIIHEPAIGDFVPGRSPKIISYYPSKASSRKNSVSVGFGVVCYKMLPPPESARQILLQIKKSPSSPDASSFVPLSIILPISLWRT